MSGAWQSLPSPVSAASGIHSLGRVSWEAVPDAKRGGAGGGGQPAGAQSFSETLRPAPQGTPALNKLTKPVPSTSPPLV